MAENVAQPSCYITTNLGVKLEEYDIFENIGKPQPECYTNNTGLGAKSGRSCAKREHNDLLRNNENAQREFAINSISPGAAGSGRPLANAEHVIPRRKEVMQRNANVKGYPSFLLGKDSIRQETQLGEKNKASTTIPRMRGSISKNVKKKKKTTTCGTKMRELRELHSQLGPKRVTPSFGNPGEDVQAVLNMFNERRLLSQQTGSAASQILRAMKDKYPRLAENAVIGKVGHVPGVESGFKVSFRAELALVGLHRPLQKGIDWKYLTRRDGNEESIALSVVASGVYEDDFDQGETLFYTGEGGHGRRSKRQIQDQKLEGGNMALYNSYHRKNSVRVIRGRPDANGPSKIVYSYDGLYKVDGWQHEPGIAGFKVFKFKLVKETGQKRPKWSPREPLRFRGHEIVQGEFHEKPGKQRRSPGREPKGFSGRADGEQSVVPEGKDFVNPQEKEEQFVILHGEEGEMIVISSDGEEDDDLIEYVGEEDDFMVIDGEEGGHCIVHENIERLGDRGHGEGGKPRNELEDGEIPVDIADIITKVCRDVKEKEFDDSAMRRKEFDDSAMRRKPGDSLKHCKDVIEEGKTAFDKGKQVEYPTREKATDDLTMQQTLLVAKHLATGKPGRPWEIR